MHTAACVETKGEVYMNSDVFAGKWKQMKGQVKEWWGNLTDDDLDVIDGKADRLAGKLQERYGWAKDRAEQEISRRLREMDTPGAEKRDRDRGMSR
jgi:uncharacterized protein YjbJ (UPF0337 family)